MLGKVLSHRYDPLLYRVAKVMGLATNPNLLTLLGVICSAFASFLVAVGVWGWGGVVVLLGGFFDMLDGAVARMGGRVSSFGAFFDSVMDRFSDFFVFIGLVYWYAVQGSYGYVLLGLFAMMGSILVPFCRARAETVIPSCKVGILERPERVILLAFGLLTGWMGLVLWIVMVLSFITVFQRILYTRNLLKG